MKKECSILICGAGITGMCLARELIKRGHKDILIIEKEPGLGAHASGRNSGILHAGIYYTPDSLKARYCLTGNRMMKQYCKQKGLALAENGKVIVASSKADLPELYNLYDRARANGADVSLVLTKQLAKIEPYAKTSIDALYTPETAAIDPKQILQSIYEELIATNKCEVLFNTTFQKPGYNSVITNNGEIGYELFINAAGAFADKIAHSYNMAKNYTLIPFKGTYKKLKNEYASMINGNIYPVPDTRNPFLGVHFSKSVHGDVYVGPTAIPAFGRENYGFFKGIDSEWIKILFQDVLLFFTNPKFRTVALEEPKKYFHTYFYNDAGRLVDNLEKTAIISAEKTGIRPQLVDWNTKELVTDFIIEQHNNTLHLLNTISPAFTSSMAFAEMVADSYI